VRTILQVQIDSGGELRDSLAQAGRPRLSIQKISLCRVGGARPGPFTPPSDLCALPRALSLCWLFHRARCRVARFLNHPTGLSPSFRNDPPTPPSDFINAPPWPKSSCVRDSTIMRRCVLFRPLSLALLCATAPAHIALIFPFCPRPCLPLFACLSAFFGRFFCLSQPVQILVERSPLRSNRGHLSASLRPPPRVFLCSFACLLLCVLFLVSSSQSSHLRPSFSTPSLTHSIRPLSPSLVP
jgi:hypothetical protein